MKKPALIFAAGLLVVVLSALLPVSGRVTAVEQAPRFGGVLRVRAMICPFNPVFDPVSEGHMFVVEQIYDGLVRFDENFNIIPAVAEYWKISEDGRKIIFYLRQGVKFHNGRELTAEDVKFSLERVIKKTSQGRLYPYFAGKVVGADDFIGGLATDISGLKVIDEYTLEIQWTRPYVSGLYLLAMSYCKILPKDLLLSQGKRFFQKPVGTGPFKFSYWLRSPRLDVLGVRLERNSGYYGKRPYIDAIDYSPHYSDDQVANGLIHIVPVVSERQLKGGLVILTNNSLRALYLAFSCDLPPLDQPEIRRAIGLGIDKKKLSEIVSSPLSALDPLDSYFPPVLPGFYPADADFEYDPEKARLLLSRKLQQEDGRRLSLDLVFTGAKTGLTEALGRELHRQLIILGIDLGVHYLKDEKDTRALKSPYLKLIDFTLDFPDPENVAESLFYSASATNQFGCRYVNSRLDELLGQAAAEPGWEKRLYTFRSIETILKNDVPAVPLFSERIRIAVLPKVKGIKPPAMGFSFLNTREIWIER